MSERDAVNQVWLVTHSVTGQKYVLKQIQTDKYWKLACDNHGMTEAEAMTRCLDSPYVARLVEEFEEDDSTYLLLKHEKGSDLINYMLGRHFEENA